MEKQTSEDATLASTEILMVIMEIHYSLCGSPLVMWQMQMETNKIPL